MCQNLTRFECRKAVCTAYKESQILSQIFEHMHYLEPPLYHTQLHSSSQSWITQQDKLSPLLQSFIPLLPPLQPLHPLPMHLLLQHLIPLLFSLRLPPILYKLHLPLMISLLFGF